MHFSAQSSATQQRGNIVDWLHSRNSLEQGARKRLQWRVTNYLGSTLQPFRCCAACPHKDRDWKVTGFLRQIARKSPFLVTFAVLPQFSALVYDECFCNPEALQNNQKPYNDV